MFTNTPKRADTPYPSDSMSASSPTLSGHAATVIARGVRVEGDFNSQGDVIIEGEVQGTISASGTLTVGSEAHIQANVIAEQAFISGRIDGNITIKKEAVFHSSARVKGDISSERVTVEAGATLEGRVQIGSATMVASSKSTDQKTKFVGDAKSASSDEKPI